MLKTVKTAQLSAAIMETIYGKIADQFEALLDAMQISDDLNDQLRQIYIPLAAIIQKRKQSGKTLIVGVNGAQGSGKSSLCTFLELILKDGFGLTTTSLSIDNLYKTREERRRLAESIHPLLLTRGVPGTHDTALGEKLLAELCQPAAEQIVRLPVFDKAIDDRLPAEQSKNAVTPVDVILFEGWCVGAKPQPEDALTSPVNQLEANEDCDGYWRSYVNQQLATSYRELFSHLDMLIMLKVPSFDCVYEWRSLQERKLANRTSDQPRGHIMDETALQRFIMHYERLTRFILEEMPQRADIVLPLNRNHLIDALQLNQPGHHGK